MKPEIGLTKKSGWPLAKLKSNEWNFSKNAAHLITEFLKDPLLAASPIGHAEAELTEFKGARRLDLVIFGRERTDDHVVTAELRMPWTADGRTPHNTKVLEDAFTKASRAGALYFMTWNVRRVVVWKTDDEKVPLGERAVYEVELTTEPLKTVADLTGASVQDALKVGIKRLVVFLDSLLTGPPRPAYIPLDRLFIGRIEAALYYPIEATVQAILDLSEKEKPFKLALERWMRDEQGWPVGATTFERNVENAARFTCYVLVNRLCFYNALRRKYDKLARIDVANSIGTGQQLKKKLDHAFKLAEKHTGYYETVFDGDFGDTLPLLSDDAVPEWRKLIRSLDEYDFGTISLDVIGRMYEQLIRPEERHRYGQHYTAPEVVDLINAFTIGVAGMKVLDPACGGGTFLVSIYARKKYLDPLQDHSRLLTEIYGCDILQYACHLSTINLAIRDLIDDDNYPRIRRGDFLRFSPGTVFHEQPVRLQAGGLPTDKMTVKLGTGQIDAVVGNPPYIQARDLKGEEKTYYWKSAGEAYPEYRWSKDSDINIHFWTKSSLLLAPTGMMGLLTQAAWLDVEYGFPLQEWMLDRFKIVAIMETEAETWFSDARVATVVTILRACDDAAQRDRNLVRFVQFRHRLADLMTALNGASGRQSSTEALRDTILAEDADAIADGYRIRVVDQATLRRQGTNGGGSYIGSKWGRFLRSLDTPYNLASAHEESFERLDQLARVGRGVTTNCDKFFLVSRITAEALAATTRDPDFQRKYGVPRDLVASGQIAIVRRKDKVDFAIEADRISPILKTGRDTYEFATSRIADVDHVVQFTARRDELTTLGRKYIEAAEREEWHLTPSFMKAGESDKEWYILRDLKTAPILFIKAMQYAPLVYWNDAAYLANQRLYMITPEANVDPQALCAVLNSTLFACERYASVKALGREAVSDAEVFSVRAFRTSDLRNLGDPVIQELKAVMAALAGRAAGPMLEEVLCEAGYNEALAHAEKNPISPDIWPAELKDETRHSLDRIILSALGIPGRSIKDHLRGLYNELTLFNRNRKIVELKAQINRRGVSSNESYTVKQFADEIWSSLTNSGTVQPRHVPYHFLDDSIVLEHVDIPASRSVGRIDTPLFQPDGKHECKIGKTVLKCASKHQLDYVLMLHGIGIFGSTPVPSEERSCGRVLGRIGKYLDSVRENVLPMIDHITKDPDLRDRILKETFKQITRHDPS